MRNRFTYVCSLFCFVCSLVASAQPGASVSFEQVVALRQVGNPVISPDGQHVAYTVRSVDWKENAYDTEIWLARSGEAPFPLTRTAKGSSTDPKWSPDGRWLAFLADRGDKAQIHVIRAAGGEAQPITKESEAISAFEWSPDGKQLAFIKNEKESKALKNRKERYGSWAVDDEEFELAHLWLVPFNPDPTPAPGEMPCLSDSANADCITLPKATRLSEGAFTITTFDWSPDGTQIAYSFQPNPLINSSRGSDVALLTVATRKTTTVVNTAFGDFFAAWAPDSKSFLYTTSADDSTGYFYRNNRVFRQPITPGTKPQQVAADFDENIGNLSWTPEGIFFLGYQKTKRHLYRIDPVSGRFSQVAGLPDQIGGVHFSKNGQRIAFTASSATTLPEVFRSDLNNARPEQLTTMSQQMAGWPTAQSEVIRWKSKDGAEIEGVLHKPQNYDPTKKYPLLVMIHGGPTGIDVPTPVPGGTVYPVLQWLEKGALVLRPNYRGSAGYGEKFRALNGRNLGVGDMWDVLSGVDELEKRGLVDPTRMGCMGWSQGGYISAFLTTNTTRFKAISVGAGISNWVTYYVNTDIHPFTRQYLKATPWQDMEIYRKTSPMTTIANAKTPTLIQHGELDKRVPIANAYELLQGLQDVGVPAKLVVYKGFGHGITKPKERLAATWHNWEWFGKYLFGETKEMPIATK